MPVIPPDLESYAEQRSSPPVPHLEALAEETQEKLRSPQMLTGQLEGRLLEMLVFASGARQVLDIGTYSGYSALSMAAALPPDGRVVTCEVDPDHAAFARRHIEASPYSDRIDLRVGPALETIEELAGPFDLVFIDADKTGYRDYYEATLPKLSERGLIVVDNTLWGGSVLDPDDDSEGTRAIREFNDHVRDDARVICVVLTVRDGVTLIRRADAGGG